MKSQGRMGYTIGDHMKKAILAAALLASTALVTPASAAVILDPLDVGDSFTIPFNGIVEGNVVTGLTAEITYTLDSVNLATNEWTFAFTVENTTSGGITSRVSAFGFNTDPDLVGASIESGTVFTTVSSGNVPQLGQIDFCATAGSNCAGGGGGGVANGDSASGSFLLDFAGVATNDTEITLADFFVRYQSITGTDFGTSGVGVEVPGPIVGAGLPGLVLACGGLLGLARRRRQKIA